MGKKELTPERVRELLDYDPETGVFRWRLNRGRVKAGDVAAPYGRDQICLDKNYVSASRLAWLLSYGEWPSGTIRYVNGDRFDRRLSNMTRGPAPRVELTQERLREVLHYNAIIGEFTWRKSTGSRSKAGAKAGCENTAGYVVISVDGKLYFAHRLVWLYEYGHWPDQEIDHVNRCPSDNRLLNLRSATRRQNQHNTGITCRNTSGYKGVTWDAARGQWSVRLGNLNLGRFRDIEEAASVYAEACKREHGEFAYIE